MLSLDTRSRAALGGSALLAFAAALAHDPIAARNQPPLIVRARHEVVHPSSRPAIVVPRRNPFDEETLPSAEHTAPPIPLPPVPANIAPLPPNAAIAGGATAERITAIVTGTHPYALLEAADRTRVVTVGERVGDASILAIGVEGVRLSDGKTLTIRTGVSSRATLSSGGSL